MSVDKSLPLSLCPACHCMTKTIPIDRSGTGGVKTPSCGKCRMAKGSMYSDDYEKSKGVVR